MLPLHYGVSQRKTLDWPFWSKPQLAKCRRKLAFESRITPKAFGAVLPLHYGVSQKEDFRLAILEQTAIGKMPEETCIQIKNNPESFRGCVYRSHYGVSQRRL